MTNRGIETIHNLLGDYAFTRDSIQNAQKFEIATRYILSGLAATMIGAPVFLTRGIGPLLCAIISSALSGISAEFVAKSAFPTDSKISILNVSLLLNLTLNSAIGYLALYQLIQQAASPNVQPPDHSLFYPDLSFARLLASSTLGSVAVLLLGNTEKLFSSATFLAAKAKNLFSPQAELQRPR